MGKFTEFKLPLKSLAPGAHHFAYHLDKQFFANMESDEVHDADIDVELNAVYAHDLYDLTFTLHGTLTLLCDRCLDDLVMPVDTTYHITVKYGADYNDDSDELLVIPESDTTLNVAYMLFDTAALAIPIKHVHPQGQCNKQMSALLKKHRADAADTDADAAADTEIDPRWAALQGFAADLDDSDN